LELIDTKEIIENLRSSASERNQLISELKSKYPIEPFLSYNEFNLQERLEFLPMKIIEFQGYLDNEKSILDDLMEQKDILVGKLYDNYRFEYDKKLDKFEIKDYYLNKDPKKIAFDKIIKKQTWTVAYFLGCVKALDKMSWIIKDFIKTLQHNI
jgi:hypothetical protein